MADGVQIELLGVKEIENILNELPAKTRRKHMLAAWRKSSKPMIKQARANISGYSKSLAKSIGNITGRDRKNAVIWVGPRVKGKWKQSGWFATMVEYGTSGVKRNRKQGYKRESDNPIFGWVKFIKPGRRYRKAQPARPFMRPAILATQNQVTDNFYKGVKMSFEKVVKKHNKVK